MNSNRERMLSIVRAGLQRNRAWFEAEATRAVHTPPAHVLPPADDLAEQFLAELARLEGKGYLVDDDESALDAIDTILMMRQVRAAITWDFDQIALTGLAELLTQRDIRHHDGQIRGDVRHEQLQIFEPAEVCISGVELALAESGSLLLRHGPGRPRIASLLAPIHIAVVRTPQLVRGLGAALALVRERYNAALFDDTSNLTLITGPSRTADIEMTLTLGIHGPRELHVVLVKG
jgi:L-lactate dehydrogenase complex protein LldG